MANERGAGQKLIPVPMSESFIEKLNEGFKAAGYDNRSQFVRDAILEKLMRLGIKIPPSIALAPDRLGKGGPKKYPEHRPEPNVTNEPADVSSANLLGNVMLSQCASAGEQHASAKRKPKDKVHPKAKVVHPAAKPPGAPLHPS